MHQVENLNHNYLLQFQPLLSNLSQQAQVMRQHCQSLVLACISRSLHVVKHPILDFLCQWKPCLVPRDVLFALQYPHSTCYLGAAVPLHWRNLRPLCPTPETQA
uniref:Uncharacterized protein n=1 Tax=Opuntia streptacantha TaxID=393608 RepID=A0A7C8ZKM6_OPUST